MSKLEQAAREVVRQHSMECLSDKAVDSLRKALASCRLTTTEQAEQEPEVWYCPDCGTLSETQVKCCPDWIRSRKVPKNFAFTCKATFDRNGQAEQSQLADASLEPVAWVWTHEHGGERLEWESIEVESIWKSTPLYAAPVRTKDLTASEIRDIWNSSDTYDVFCVEFARAVIAKFKEKNNVK